MAGVPKFTPHPKSAPGDFYVEQGQCLACGVPPVVAPELVGWVDEKVPHCFWKKQPENLAELERAIAVVQAQELECHRYAGTDPAILNRLSPAYCDYPVQSQDIIERPAALLPHFALSDNRVGLLTRLWRSITGRNSPKGR